MSYTALSRVHTIPLLNLHAYLSSKTVFTSSSSFSWVPVILGQGYDSMKGGASCGKIMQTIITAPFADVGCPVLVT